MPTLLRLFKEEDVRQVGGGSTSTGHWHWLWLWHWFLSAEASRSRPVLVGTAALVGLAKRAKVDTQYRGARHG